MTETTTSTDGTTIAFDRQGSGPALVLVDAASGFRGFGPLEPLTPALAENFTVFRYDRRGRGESGDTTPFAIEREIEDLQALLDVAGGSAFVFGYSSGAVLAMHAAAHGAAIEKLVLFEPPLELDERPADEPDLGAQTAQLVAAGRRGDAVLHFNESIGVPSEVIEGMRESPVWPALEALAHTLVYDTVIAGTVPDLAAVTCPTLVIDSAGSDGRLTGWSQRVATQLPDATHRSLAGGWHGVEPGDLARALADWL